MSEYLIAELREMPNVSVRLGVELVDGDGDEQLERSSSATGRAARSSESRPLDYS